MEPYSYIVSLTYHEIYIDRDYRYIKANTEKPGLFTQYGVW